LHESSGGDSTDLNLNPPHAPGVEFEPMTRDRP